MGKVKPELYAQVGTSVMDAGQFSQAITVLDAGARKYADKKGVFTPIIDTCAKRATEAGDSDSIAKLKSLGYL